MKELKTTQLFALFISCVALIGIIAFGGYWTHSINKAAINQQTSVLGSLSRSQAAFLERRLSNAFSATKILAQEIQHHDGKEYWFEEYAVDLLDSMDGIAMLQIEPNGVIEKISPLKGNEAAIGLDILAGSKHKDEALLAIKNHQYINIGPIKLVQGGLGIIGRSPVFLYKGTQKEVFWGFTSAVIYLDSLLNATQLTEFEKEGYRYKLTRVDSETNELITLLESAKPLTETQATSNLVVPAGEWSLSISKPMKAELFNNTITGNIISFIVALIISVSLYLILMQPQKLRALVKEKTKELEELAYTDPLTDLPNRRYLQESLPGILYNNHKHQRMAAFIYFDLDDFKRINDTIGHDVGDQILVIVANRLNKFKQESHLIVRLGGDEFAILLNDIKSYEEVVDYADRILDSTRAPITLDNKKFSVQTTLGIAMVPKHGRDLITIMQNADMAMYQAKLEGKNKYSFFRNSMRSDAYSLIQDEYDLAQGIKENEFELYYQPQFDLETNQICAAEALIRWNHPEKGLVFPDHFIPLAESSGKIVELGYWILENGIASQARRKQQGEPEIVLHINLSPKQISDPNIVHLVQELLLKYRVSPNTIGFEITETLILEEIDLAKKVLQIFKNMGMCIAIDDFGTGYSSLAQLKNLPVSLLKIDRSFVMDLENDADDKKIVEAIIAMTHKLHLKVLAEGIETEEQHRMLNDLQCDFGQGYYVSKPVTEEEFRKLVHAHNNKNAYVNA
ncbi:MAG: EAL domain-containing protein [Marinomonas sp.]